MAHDVHRPHDKLFRTVFADPRQAAALLQAHLPESIAGRLRWSSLTLQDRTFVDDQPQVGPQAVRGRLQGRIAQLKMMARYRHRREALQHAARLLAQMLTGGGGEAVRPLVRYLLATQTRNTARRFRDELHDAVPGAGGDLMTTYAEELIREGERKGHVEGRLEGRVDTIEALLRAGVEWPAIEEATGIGQDALRALKQGLAGPNQGNDHPQA